MISENELLKDAVSRLEKVGVDYMVTGSFVLGIYSQDRMTHDIDIVIEVSSDDTSKLTALFESDDFYISEDAVRRALQHRGMFNVIHVPSALKLDFFIRKEGDFQQQAFSRRKRVTFHGFPLWVITAEDLVLSKLLWARQSESALQLHDVRQLMDDYKSMDLKYLSDWAAKLGVDDLLQKAMGNG